MKLATTAALWPVRLGRRFLPCNERRIETALAFVGLAALALSAGPAIIAGLGEPEAATLAAPVAQAAPSDPAASGSGRRGATSSAAIAHHGWAAGAYGGVADTLDSTVRIVNPGRTELTISDFPWLGRPFKAPPYYGVRIQRWSGDMLGGMLDFTHAKALGKTEATGTFKGTHNGKPMPEKARMVDVFNNFEFSHGHNMLTLNGMLRGLPLFGLARPYVGAGGGISLPHTEIGFKADNARTYEYQYAGIVGQALAGLEVRIGPATIFLEYKFSYAPYDVPLSHTYMGGLLVTDLWRQFTAWRTGEAPPGGRLTTLLQTHHAIAGAMYNVPRPISAR